MAKNLQQTVFKMEKTRTNQSTPTALKATIPLKMNLLPNQKTVPVSAMKLSRTTMYIRTRTALSTEKLPINIFVRFQTDWASTDST